MQVIMSGHVHFKVVKEEREYFFSVPTGAPADEAIAMLDALKESIVNFKETHTAASEEKKDGAQEESSYEEVNV